MSTSDEKFRDVLNFSGFPYQHHCADKIARLDQFQVAAEVPFTHPRTNGPLLGVHGSIDMLAARPAQDDEWLLCFVIECKKANDKIKNWVLLANEQQYPKWPTFVYSQLDEENGELLGVTRSATFPRLGYQRGRDYNYCVNGIEINTALTSANSNATEKIYNPLRQVLHAARAFESAVPKVVEGIEYFRESEHSRRLFIPVILTTANIYVADFPREKVAVGEIAAGDLSVGAPRQWATYEFPLPDFLSYEVPRGNGSTFVDKRTVFIVNDTAIDDFFSKATLVENLSGRPSE